MSAAQRRAELRRKRLLANKAKRESLLTGNHNLPQTTVHTQTNNQHKEPPQPTQEPVHNDIKEPDSHQHEEQQHQDSDSDPDEGYLRHSHSHMKPSIAKIVSGESALEKYRKEFAADKRLRQRDVLLLMISVFIGFMGGSDMVNPLPWFAAAEVVIRTSYIRKLPAFPNDYMETMDLGLRGLMLTQDMLTDLCCFAVGFVMASSL